MSQAPLGAPPPGTIGWRPPDVMVRTATPPTPLVEIPKVKMWVLAALSAFVFWLNTPGITLVVPLGVVFAVWCWLTTREPLRSLARAGLSVTEIWAARWVAVGLAGFGLAQVVIWTR